MGIYKTYKEAVLANGRTNGVSVSSSGDEFYTDESWLGRCSVTYLCSPADYLETLESFLASGKLLKRGDLVVSWDGSVNRVHGESNMNTPDSDDKSRFILQAAADQVEAPEEKEAFDAIDTKPQQVESLGKPEWKHGDDVVVNGKRMKFACLDPFDKVLAICCSDEEWEAPMYCHVNSLQKPETPAEREGRERMEAAYELYCIHHDAISRLTMTYEEFLKVKNPEGWMAVVDKTGYRKEASK